MQNLEFRMDNAPAFLTANRSFCKNQLPENHHPG
jgi:hypothetical protein